MLNRSRRATKEATISRHELSDDQWDLIADLFPPPAKIGRPQRSRRQIVDAILWILATGAPWRDLPEEQG